MLYSSAKNGLMEISDMPLPHVRNALAKLERQRYKGRVEYELIGAMNQSVVEREKNPSTSLLKKQFDGFKAELSEVKKFQTELKEVVGKY